MAAQIPESAREVLDGDRVAHMVTLGREGSPHVTCVWVGFENDEVVVGTLFDQRKLRDLRADPRVTLSIETGRKNSYGLEEYLVIYGRARVTEGGAPELLQALARTYLGPDVRFPPMDDPPPGYVTRISVERIGGVGPWVSQSRGG